MLYRPTVSFISNAFNITVELSSTVILSALDIKDNLYKKNLKIEAFNELTWSQQQNEYS